MFRRSPFRSLQEHMRIVIECVDYLPPLFHALAEGDLEKAAEYNKKVADAESEADTVKHELRDHLPKGLFMPVDRRDLLQILNMQDSIADVAEDIAGVLVQRKMIFPEPMKEKLLIFMEKCTGVVHSCSLVIEELDELLEIGFRGLEASRVEEMLDALNLEEDATDQLLDELSEILFGLEDEMKPVTVMFWYKLLEWIGDVADFAEKVGNRLRLLLAK